MKLHRMFNEDTEHVVQKGSGNEIASDDLQCLDSRSFGYLRYHSQCSASPENSHDMKAHLRKAIREMQQQLDTGTSSNAIILLRLGHFHLLLEEYTQALSAYQYYLSLGQNSPEDPCVLYGLGIIYFHMKSYQQAVQCLHKVLHLAPSFERATDIHLRLGTICKGNGEYRTAMEHFQTVLQAPGPNQVQAQYYTAHIYQLQNQFLAAKHAYETMLEMKHITTEMKARALRQLGWLYHQHPAIAEGSDSKAVAMLELATQTDPMCGLSWYYLGRCHADHGRVHDAFIAYQQSVQRSGHHADTWCSIGILYQSMHQAVDSLHSYLAAVYLDVQHLLAWTNLACLYESLMQPIDALLCYKNAFNVCKPSTNGAVLNRIHQRLSVLEPYVRELYQAIVCQPCTLPTLSEAWSTCVPLSVSNKRPPPAVCPILHYVLPATTVFEKGDKLKEPAMSQDRSSSLSCDFFSPCTAVDKKLSLTGTLEMATSSVQNGYTNHRPWLGTRRELHVCPGGDIHLKATNSIKEEAACEHTPTVSHDQCSNDITNQTHVFSVTPTLPLASPNTVERHVGTAFLGVTSFSTCESLVPSPSSHCMTTHLQQHPLCAKEAVVSSSPGPSPLVTDRQRTTTSVDHTPSSSNQPSASHTPLLNDSSSSAQLLHVRSLEAIGRSAQCHVTHSSSQIWSPVCLHQSLPLPARPEGQSMCPPHQPTTPVQPGHPPLLTDQPGHPSLPTDQPGHPPLLTDQPGHPSLPTDQPGHPPLPIDQPGHPTLATDHPGHPTLPTDHPGHPTLPTDHPGHPTLPTDHPGHPTLPTDQPGHPHRTWEWPGDLSQVSLHVMGGLCHMGDYLTKHLTEKSSVLRNGQPSEQGGADIGQLLDETCIDFEGAQAVEALVGQSRGRAIPPNREGDLLALKHVKVPDCTEDSSSGVSSIKTKLSTSSIDHNFPSDPFTPSTSTPSTTPSDSSPNDEPSFCYPHACAVTLLPQPNPSLGEEAEYMLKNPLRPPRPPLCSPTEDLHPSCPVFQVSTVDDLFPRLHSFCTNPSLPICLIKGLCSAVEFDLEKFSTATLKDTSPDHEMEIREQVLQAPDENWDPTFRKQVWRCESERSEMRIHQYAQYQTTVLNTLQEEEAHRNGFGDESTASGRKRRKKQLKFGTNVDLSDKVRWHLQLAEIEKLPRFIQVTCPEANLLNYVGHTILGMNTVQLYMKVPGCRTPGHQENNNFCSVNINIGPGACEWFAVHNQYWGAVHTLCEKHKLSFLVGSWWPILEELERHKIPVYRFTQYKGDVVWINPGTVHWVQAIGVCNNIAWNSGPITAHQFRMAWERYLWNKIQNVRSIVPMVHLSWNLARRVRCMDHSLVNLLKDVLESSFNHCQALLSSLKRANIPVVWHGRVKGESSPCCANCLDEVFNILFVTNQNNQYVVFCNTCAGSMRKKHTPLSVLQQYSMEELHETLQQLIRPVVQDGNKPVFITQDGVIQ